jgi:hypothetical protein
VELGLRDGIVDFFRCELLVDLFLQTHRFDALDVTRSCAKTDRLSTWMMRCSSVRRGVFENETTACEVTIEKISVNVAICFRNLMTIR